MLVAALTGRLPARAPEPPARVAAVVNGESIPLSDVEAILKARPVPGDRPTDSEYRDMQREALDMLVDDLLLKQFLRKSVPSIRPAEVNTRLGELKDALKAQGQTIEAYCRESGQTTEQIRDNLITMLQRKAFLASHVDDAAARKYYDDNREFFDQVTVRVSHILLRLPAGSAPADVAAARAKLGTIRQEIVSGRLSFADAVKLHSQCPSAAAGGDIGYFPRKGVVEEPFARAAFGMKRDELSDVIQTSYGLHLIRLTDRRAGAPSEFNKIVDTVREFAGQEMLAGIVARERLAAKIESKLDEEQNPKQKPKVHRSLFGAH
jgi:peptidyl-prolyl cis-trans isomerase C